MNPFTFGTPIKDSVRFIGRKAEIRQIANRLLSSAHESTSIVGERRIGKSSLLYHLSTPEIAAGYGLTRNKFCLVYVDFQGLTDITSKKFWQRVLKKMSRVISTGNLPSDIQTLINQDEIDLFDLEDFFDTIVDKGITAVIFMDEFEYVIANPNLTSEFFGGLRALAIHHGVAFIPATRRELVEPYESKGSPLTNIFANVVLRPFSRDEVEEMLSKYMQNMKYTCSSKEQDIIWALGGGHPLFTQMAGHYLVEGKEQNLSDDVLTAFILNQLDQQGGAHFNYLWSTCSDGEKSTLLITIALGLQKDFKKTILPFKNPIRVRAQPSQDLIKLTKKGILNETNGLYTIFSSSFENWIRCEIVAPIGETEASVVEWINSENRGYPEDIKSTLPDFKKNYWRIIGSVVNDLSKEFTITDSCKVIEALLHPT